MPGLKRERTMPTRRPRPLALAGIWRIGMGMRRSLWRGDGSRCRRSTTLRRAAGCVDVAGDLEVEARHARHLARRGEEPHLADVEVAQDLRADAVVAQVDLGVGRHLGRRARARRSSCALSGRCSSTTTPRPASAIASSAAAMLHECDVPPTSSRSITDSGSCTRTSVSRVRRNRPAHEREMRRVGELVAIDDEPERAVRRRERPLGDALDQPLGAAPVRDEIGDRADLEAVRRARNRSRSGSRAIVPSAFMISHSTAAGVRPASAARSQQASVCPARASTPPGCAISGNTWPGCTMSDGFASARGRHADRVRAVLRGDAGGDALRRLDRDGEVGAVDRAVLRHHRREVEALGVRRGDRHADEPAAVGRQEVDLLGRHEIRGEDEIALVLAVLLVDQHGHPPGLEVGDEIGNGGKAHGAAVHDGIAHFTLGRRPIWLRYGLPASLAGAARPLMRVKCACPRIFCSFAACSDA